MNLKHERERIAESDSSRRMAVYMTDVQTRSVLDLEVDGFTIVTVYVRFETPGRVAVHMKKPNGINVQRNTHRFKRAVIYPNGEEDHFPTHRIKLRTEF